MRLTYTYIIHCFSGGMMLSNTLTGEWDFSSFEVGTELHSPNSEVKITVLDKEDDTVVVNVKYRNNEKTVTVSRFCDERFSDEANAYGFSYVLIVRE